MVASPRCPFKLIAETPAATKPMGVVWHMVCQPRPFARSDLDWWVVGM